MPPSSAVSLLPHTTPARSPRRLKPPSRTQDQQIADLQAQQAAPQYAPQPQYAPPPAAAAAPEVGGTDMVTQLENLKKLLDEGVLTQAEFDTQKQKVLASS